MKVKTKSWLIPKSDGVIFELETDVKLTLSAMKVEYGWDIWWEDTFVTFLFADEKLYIDSFGFKKENLYLKVRRDSGPKNFEVKWELKIPSKRGLIMVKRFDSAKTYFSLSIKDFDKVGVN